MSSCTSEVSLCSEIDSLSVGAGDEDALGPIPPPPPPLGLEKWRRTSSRGQTANKKSIFKRYQSLLSPIVVSFFLPLARKSL